MDINRSIYEVDFQFVLSERRAYCLQLEEVNPVQNEATVPRTQESACYKHLDSLVCVFSAQAAREHRAFGVWPDDKRPIFARQPRVERPATFEKFRQPGHSGVEKSMPGQF